MGLHLLATDHQAAQSGMYIQSTAEVQSFHLVFIRTIPEHLDTTLTLSYHNWWFVG